MRHQIVILAYNEENSIAELLCRLPAQECLVVVDGDDTTAEIAEKYGCDVFASTYKRGYGQALIDGLMASYATTHDYATVMDIGTCRPKDLSLNTNADILVRNRVSRMLNKRVLLSKVAALGLSLAIHSRVREATFGYRTYKLDVVIPLLSKLTTNGHATNMELLGLAIKAGLNIEYQPVPYIIDGKTQLRANDLSEALRTLWTLAITRQ